MIILSSHYNELMKKGQSHLTIEEREIIFEGLNAHLSFAEIANSINKSRTTISREVKKHRQRHESEYELFRKCHYIETCTLTNICDMQCGDKLCKTCPNRFCRSVCNSFKLYECSLLSKSPYVCNGCSKFSTCRNPIKYKYSPSYAHNAYLNTLKDSRKGPDITEDNLNQINNILVPLMQDNKQHLYHIYVNHEDEIPVGMRTLYNYIDKGYLNVHNIDLPNKVSYKPRNKKSHKIHTSNKLNRTYDDYNAYISEHPESHVIQIDTVEGVKGEQLLLTIHAQSEKFQIAHFIKNKEAKNIKPVFELYKERLDDDELFQQYFSVVVTDNGSEFSEILFLEDWGIKVFFCDPYASYQKGACENNHKHIRYFFKKGESFKDFHQKHIWLMMSHINSECRAELNKKCPYEVTEFYWGKKILDAFHIKRIAPDNVVLDKKILIK